MTSESPETQRLIAEVWQRSQPLMLERLAQLEEAARAAVSGHLPEDLRALAESNAHKLSGTLGMFGFQEGTDLARLLEQDLQQPSANGERLLDLTRDLRRTLFPPVA